MFQSSACFRVRREGGVMDGASPSTTIYDQVRFLRGIVVDGLAPSMLLRPGENSPFLEICSSAGIA